MPVSICLSGGRTEQADGKKATRKPSDDKSNEERVDTTADCLRSVAWRPTAHALHRCLVATRVATALASAPRPALCIIVLERVIAFLESKIDGCLRALLPRGSGIEPDVPVT